MRGWLNRLSYSPRCLMKDCDFLRTLRAVLIVKNFFGSEALVWYASMYGMPIVQGLIWFDRVARLIYISLLPCKLERKKKTEVIIFSYCCCVIPCKFAQACRIDIHQFWLLTFRISTMSFLYFATKNPRFDWIVSYWNVIINFLHF